MLISSKPLVAKGNTKPQIVKLRRMPTKSSSNTTLPPIKSLKKRPSPSPKTASKPKSKVPSSEKKQEPLSELQEAEMLLVKPPLNDPPQYTCGTATIRFNHYNKAFPVHNGVLKWQDVDDEYCLSFVYRGNFKRDIVPEEMYDPSHMLDNAVRRDSIGLYFLGVVSGTQYRLLVEEDPAAGIGAEGMRLNSGPIKIAPYCEPSSIAGKCPLISGNAAVHDITNMLKSMKASDLQSEEANRLRELRDIEDVLYSGT